MIKHIIARGIGFSPGSAKFIVTHGLGIGEAVTIPQGRIIYARGYRNIVVGSRSRTVQVSFFLQMENGAREQSEDGALMITELEPFTQGALIRTPGRGRTVH